MKGLNATRGQDNYLVKSADELRARFAERPDTDFLLQEFLPNDGDYRIIVAGGQARFAMYRTPADGKHMNNTSQGGQAVLVNLGDVSRRILDDCITAAATFGRDFAGVDVVLHKDTGAYYFFEVNRSPQIESGMFVAEKAEVLAQYLYDEATA
jgi:glutathione synthase/RimK-type ligase-like ATP-grasp enzyme